MAENKKSPKKLDFFDAGFIAAVLLGMIGDGILIYSLLAIGFPIIGPALFGTVLFFHYLIAIVILFLMFSWFKRAEKVELSANELKMLSSAINFLLSSRVVMPILYVLPLPILQAGIMIGVLQQSKLVRMAEEIAATAGEAAVVEAAEAGEALEAAEAVAEAGEAAEAAEAGEAGAVAEGATDAEEGAEKASEEVVGAEDTVEQAQREAQGEPSERTKKPEPEKEEEPESEREKKKEDEDEEEPEDWDNRQDDEEGEDEEEDEEQVDLSRFDQRPGKVLPFHKRENIEGDDEEEARAA